MYYVFVIVFGYETKQSLGVKTKMSTGRLVLGFFGLVIEKCKLFTMTKPELHVVISCLAMKRQFFFTVKKLKDTKRT